MTAHDPYQALRNHEYRWFLLGSAPLFMAAQIQSLVMGWQVYAMTHDPLSLGLIGLAEALPFLGLSLFGGWAADRWERRRFAGPKAGGARGCRRIDSRNSRRDAGATKESNHGETKI